jgi:hypothetical protein
MGMEQIAQSLKRYLPGWKSYFRLAQTSNDVSGFGFMDPPKAQSTSTQAMETWHHDLSWACATLARSTMWQYKWLLPVVVGGTPGDLTASGVNGGLFRQPWNTQTHMTSTSRTARCGPACPVVWQGCLALRGTPYADLRTINSSLLLTQ